MGPIIRLIDSYTGEDVNYEETATWYDDTVMNDSKVDNVIYRKKDGKYYRRIFEGAINVKWFGAKGDGDTDDTVAIKKAIDAMFGKYEPTVLLHLTQGNTLFFPRGTYKITSRLLVTKSCSRIIGEGWTNTIIRYGGIGAIKDIICFKDSNNSELSYIKLDGAATSLTQGAKACLGIDLAAFFTSHDVYMINSSLYGLRASHLWESYFSNLYIRETGKYSTLGIPGAGICFTAVDSESIKFPSHESNNTTFVKSTLAAAGGQVRVDISAAATSNISFLDSVCETDFYLPEIQRNEDIWHLEGVNHNFQIKGGFYASNMQNAEGTGLVFNIVSDWNGGCISNYNISIRKNKGFTRHKKIMSIASYNSVKIDNVTITDAEDVLDYVLSIGGYNFISPVVGNINYRCSGNIKRFPDFIFADNITKNLFNGVVVIQNGNNTVPGNNTIIANFEKMQK